MVLLRFTIFVGFVLVVCLIAQHAIATELDVLHPLREFDFALLLSGSGYLSLNSLQFLYFAYGLFGIAITAESCQ